RMARLGPHQEEHRAQILRGPAVRRFLREVESLFLERLADLDGGPQLRVVLAAVTDAWDVECVEGVVLRIVVVERRLLIRSKAFLRQTGPGVLVRVDVSRASLQRGEE